MAGIGQFLIKDELALKAAIKRVFAAGTTEGALAGWDTRGRSSASSRSVYHAENNKAVVDHLYKKGFRLNGMNSDPAKGPVVYSKRVEPVPGSGDNFTGSRQHTVMVHPSGEWEHYSESQHQGLAEHIKSLFLE